MEEPIELNCPGCGRRLGFVCKECQEEVELPRMECDCGEVELTAFMSDEDIEEANKDAE